MRFRSCSLSVFCVFQRLQRPLVAAADAILAGVFSVRLLERGQMSLSPVSSAPLLADAIPARVFRVRVWTHEQTFLAKRPRRNDA